MISIKKMTERIVVLEALRLNDSTVKMIFKNRLQDIRDKFSLSDDVDLIALSERINETLSVEYFLERQMKEGCKMPSNISGVIMIGDDVLGTITIEGVGDRNLVSFESCVIAASENEDMVKNFDRLHGTNLELSGSLIDLLIDKATGRQNSDVRKFLDFVYDAIFMPIILSQGEDALGGEDAK